MPAVIFPRLDQDDVGAVADEVVQEDVIVTCSMAQVNPTLTITQDVVPGDQVIFAGPAAGKFFT